MRITSRILSIPPYLSTTWKNISSLHMKEEGGLHTLVIVLQNQAQVDIPGLSKETIEEIFDAHARSSETVNSLKNPLEGPFSFSMPVETGGTFNGLATSMQHNPAQSDLPPIPPDVLKKITMIAKAFGLEDTSTLGYPEPDCYCVYCQVTRAFHEGEAPLTEQIEEISNDDLKFRDWEVKQTSNQLYSVTNPLEPNEQYSVFLGTPLGCTCGNKSCEHIRAVLST
jgi:hypothetical protein